jgi:hypothetical protein
VRSTGCRKLAVYAFLHGGRERRRSISASPSVDGLRSAPSRSAGRRAREG